jgi:hypothetical protein
MLDDVAIAARPIEGWHVKQEHRPKTSPEQLQLGHLVDDIIDELTDRYPISEIIGQSHQVEQDDRQSFDAEASQQSSGGYVGRRT